MPNPLVPDALRGQVFTTATAREAGLTRDHLRSRAWRSLFRNVHCDATLPDSLDVRVRAVALLLPAGAVLAGTTAAWLHGADVRRPDDPVDVLCRAGRAVRCRPGLRVRTSTLTHDDVVEVRGLPVTSPVRTACDLARGSGLVEAVVALDGLLQAGAVELPQVREELGRWAGRRGVRTASRAVDLARRGAESPMETRLRLVLVLGGLPEPELQVVVVDRWGHLVARLDLGFREERVGVEYDGRVHEGRVVQDASRDNALADEDWRLKRYGGLHVYRQPRLVVAQVGRELERRGGARRSA